MSPVINSATQTGLNRRRGSRGRIEQVLELSKHLDGPDRMLIERVYRHGITVAGIARLMNCPERKLRYRLLKLLKMMNSPLFEFVVANREWLPESMWRTAKLVVLQGCTLRRAARLSNQSLYRVRKDMRILGVLAGV